VADWRLWEGESGRWGSGLGHTPPITMPHHHHHYDY